MNITRTSAQAKIENEAMMKESTCPECSHWAIGVIGTKGVFSIQECMYYSCICGCKWNTGWRPKQR